MTEGFRIEIHDPLTGRIEHAVESGIEHLRDFRPLWARLRRPWERSRYRMFQSLGSSTGARWPSYDDTPEGDHYVYVKAAILGIGVSSHDVLRWAPGRERLFPSLVSTRHPLSIWSPRRRRLAMGSAVPYASNHDRGIGRAPEWAGGQAIPKRPLLRFGRYFLDKMQDAISEQAAELAAEFREAGDRRTVRAGLSSRMVDRLL